MTARLLLQQNMEQSVFRFDGSGRQTDFSSPRMKEHVVVARIDLHWMDDTMGGTGGSDN